MRSSGGEGQGYRIRVASSWLLVEVGSSPFASQEDWVEKEPSRYFNNQEGSKATPGYITFTRFLRWVTATPPSQLSVCSG